MKYRSLNQFKNNFKNYTELRVQENRRKNINIINAENKAKLIIDIY